MDHFLYKTITTKRGLKYAYAAIPAEGAPRDTLLFIHGVPSSSYDWRNQVDFFRKAGFSLIIPDMLGAGESDKPVDWTLFQFKAMAGDVVDILDAENVEKVIVVGHDWGSMLTSRLASYYPERCKAYTFVAIGYSPTSADFDYEASLTATKQALGYETYGYWEFFFEDGAEKIIEEHLDSWLSLMHPFDPTLWKTDVAVRGTMKAWLLGDKHAPLPSYLTEEDKKHFTDRIRSGGIASALNWYKGFARGISAEDKGIPEANQTITKPVLFIACKKDYVCVPLLYAKTNKYCKDLTVKEFDTGHWAQLQAPDQFNADLLEWINGFIGKA
ncbi:Alpha/Beta hydrolase protein [Fomitopsis betulina]|nr:Alpha/Beta hydrolase protein [Fomitopsis betulina]